MADNPYDIPQAINAHAEENIRQAHAADLESDCSNLH